jgi:hypothetical protein
MAVNIEAGRVLQWLEVAAQSCVLRALVLRGDFHNPRMPQSARALA